MIGLTEFIKEAMQSVRAGEPATTAQLPPLDFVYPDYCAEFAAEAERLRQVKLAFQLQALRVWPELARVATTIDEANGVWRKLIAAEGEKIAGLAPWPWSGEFLIGVPPALQPAPTPRPKTHQRAGITKRKTRGQSKTRRKMAAQSRRRNRRGAP